MTPTTCSPTPSCNESRAPIAEGKAAGPPDGASDASDVLDVFQEPPASPSPDRVRRLVDEHRRFLDFLERRLGDRTLAEDVLQDAFAKTLSAALPNDDEALLSWFYRVLKNAVIDQQRRVGARQRALDNLADALDQPPTIAALENEACRCVLAISESLRPEYAEALRRIELDGVAVKDFARDIGIAAQNAATRVFRARRALQRELARACGTCATHGCFDCSCS
jgi:RNA polymerase sigma-70 factor (ECF subfamily)